MALSSSRLKNLFGTPGSYDSRSKDNRPTPIATQDMNIASQRMVFSGGQHVGTINYNSAGKVVDRDWVVDGVWGKHRPDENAGLRGVPVLHNYGPEMGVNRMTQFAAARVAGDRATMLSLGGGVIPSAQPNYGLRARDWEARHAAATGGGGGMVDPVPMLDTSTGKNLDYSNANIGSPNTASGVRARRGSTNRLGTSALNRSNIGKGLKITGLAG